MLPFCFMRNCSQPLQVPSYLQLSGPSQEQVWLVGSHGRTFFRWFPPSKPSVFKGPFSVGFPTNKKSNFAVSFPPNQKGPVSVGFPHGPFSPMANFPSVFLHKNPKGPFFGWFPSHKPKRALFRWFSPTKTQKGTLKLRACSSGLPPPNVYTPSD